MSVVLRSVPKKLQPYNASDVHLFAPTNCVNLLTYLRVNFWAFCTIYCKIDILPASPSIREANKGIILSLHSFWMFAVTSKVQVHELRTTPSYGLTPLLQVSEQCYMISVCHLSQIGGPRKQFYKILRYTHQSSWFLLAFSTPYATQLLISTTRLIASTLISSQIARHCLMLLCTIADHDVDEIYVTHQ